MAIIISVDECKEEIEGYDPSRASEFHVESARIADARFAEVIRNSPGISEVILLGGGSASGKTEYLHTYLENYKAIIFDSTLSTVVGAQTKISKCRKQGKAVSIHYVFPDDLIRAYVAFLSRERKLNEDIFYQTHSGSRSTLLELIRLHEDLSVTLIESSYRNPFKPQYVKYAFTDRNDMDEFVRLKQLSESEIKKLIQEHL